MKKVARNPVRFDAFELITELARQDGASLRDGDALGKIIERIRTAATEAISSDTFVYGKRTEELFERIVVSLGRCRLVRREDIGDVFHRDEDEVAPPDFRLVLDDGSQMLVEVKNFDQRRASFKPQRFGAKSRQVPSARPSIVRNARSATLTDRAPVLGATIA